MVSKVSNDEVEDFEVKKEEKENGFDNDDDDDEFQPNKKVKTSNKSTPKNRTKAIKVEKKDNGPSCEVCFQKLNDPDLRLYNGHPNNAQEEYIVLLDPKLCLFNGDELDVSEADVRAMNKITSFR